MVSFPAERDAKPLVHADAVPAAPVALEGLQPIARWAAEVVERLGDVQQLQLALDDGPEAGRHPSRRFRRPFPEQVSGGLVPEGLDHRYIIPV